MGIKCVISSENHTFLVRIRWFEAVTHKNIRVPRNLWPKPLHYGFDGAISWN